MTTLAAPERVRLAWARLTLSSDALAAIGLTALAGIMIAITWNTWGDLGRDTGYDLVAGERVATGDLPYTDFTYYYGPLAPALAGLAAWIGGAGIGSGIGLGIVLSLAIVAVTYALGRKLAGPTGGFLAAAITIPVAFGPTNLSFVLPHTYSATAGILATLCFLLCLVRFGEREARSWLVLSGVAAGMVALTRPELVLAVVIAGVLWLAFRARQSGRSTLRDAACLVAPAAVIPLAVYGAFLTAVPFHRLVFENLYPVDTLAAAGNAVVRLHAPLTASSFGEVAFKLALYAAGIAALVALGTWLDRDTRARRPLIALIGIGTVLAVALAVARPETLRYGLEFAWGWIPAGVVIASGVLLWRARRPDGRTAGALAVLAVCVALAVIAATTYAAFFVHSTRAQPALYAVPLAAIFLARLHLVEIARSPSVVRLGAIWLAFLAAAGIGLTLKDAAAESATVRGPGGALAAPPADAAPMQAALDLIGTNTKAGDSILLAPQLTTLYTLSGRTDPLEQLSLLPGALPTRADEFGAIAALEEAGVRLVVTDRREFTEYGHTAFGQSFDTSLAGWIRTHFDHLATLPAGPGGTHTLDVWIKGGTS